MKYLIGMGVDWAVKLLNKMGWRCIVADENDKVIVLYKRNGKIKDIRILGLNDKG